MNPGGVWGREDTEGGLAGVVVVVVVVDRQAISPDDRVNRY